MGLTIPRYTVEDLEQFRGDGNRYELLDGVLHVTPAPALRHQIVAGRIQTQLGAAVSWPGHAHVVGPGVVRHPPLTHLEPDVFVFPTRFPPWSEWDEITER